MDSTTLVINLTYLGTLGLGLLMFLCLFILSVVTLLLVGAGRLTVILVLALFGRLRREETVPLVRLVPSSASSTRFRDQSSAGPSSGVTAPAPTERVVPTQKTPSSSSAPAMPSRAKPPSVTPAPTGGASTDRGTTTPGPALRPLTTKARSAWARVSDTIGNLPAAASIKREEPALASDWAAAVEAAKAREAARSEQPQQSTPTLPKVSRNSADGRAETPGTSTADDSRTAQGDRDSTEAKAPPVRTVKRPPAPRASSAPLGTSPTRKPASAKPADITPAAAPAPASPPGAEPESPRAAQPASPPKPSSAPGTARPSAVNDAGAATKDTGPAAPAKPQPKRPSAPPTPTTSPGAGKPRTAETGPGPKPLSGNGPSKKQRANKG